MEVLVRSLVVTGTVFYLFLWGPGSFSAEPGALPIIRDHVEHNGAGDAWRVVDTPNFRVLHRTDVEYARRAALHAEDARTATYRRWFENVAADWSPRCEIVLYESGAAYAHATGTSPALPGYTQVKCDGARVIRRQIDINGDTADLLTAVLPHEVNHAVMWSEFGRGRLPRWAHEAMAVLSEPRGRIECHLRTLPAHHQSGELFTISELISLKGYPDRQRFGPFYAQSVSLVEFLTSRAPPATFIEFLHDGHRHSYEAALRQHYGWSLAELEYHWARYALDPRPGQAISFIQQ